MLICHTVKWVEKRILHRDFMNAQRRVSLDVKPKSDCVEAYKLHTVVDIILYRRVIDYLSTLVHHEYNLVLSEPL